MRAREALAQVVRRARRGQRRKFAAPGGSQPRARAGGGRVRASARRAAVPWGAPRASRVSVCESKQAETERPKGTQTYFCPGNPSLSEVPAFLQEPGNGQRRVECWLDRWCERCAPLASRPPSLASQRSLHFILESMSRGRGGVEGGLYCPLLAFS